MVLCISQMRPRLDVIQHRALWSPDFPRSCSPLFPPNGGMWGGQERDRLASLDAVLMIAYYWWLSRERA